MLNWQTGLILLSLLPLSACKTPRSGSDIAQVRDNPEETFLRRGQYRPISELDDITVKTQNLDLLVGSLRDVSSVLLENLPTIGFHPREILFEFVDTTISHQEDMLRAIRNNSLPRGTTTYREQDIMGVLAATWDIKTDFESVVSDDALLGPLPYVVTVLDRRLFDGIQALRTMAAVDADAYRAAAELDYRALLMTRIAGHIPELFRPIPPDLSATIKNISKNWAFLKNEKDRRGLFHGDIGRDIRDFSQLSQTQNNVLDRYLRNVKIPDNSGETQETFNNVIDLAYSYRLFSAKGNTHAQP